MLYNGYIRGITPAHQIEFMLSEDNTDITYHAIPPGFDFWLSCIHAHLAREPFLRCKMEVGQGGIEQLLLPNTVRYINPTLGDIAPRWTLSGCGMLREVVGVVRNIHMASSGADIELQDYPDVLYWDTNHDQFPDVNVGDTVRVGYYQLPNMNYVYRVLSAFGETYMNTTILLNYTFPRDIVVQAAQSHSFAKPALLELEDFLYDLHKVVEKVTDSSIKLELVTLRRRFARLISARIPRSIVEINQNPPEIAVVTPRSPTWQDFDSMRLTTRQPVYRVNSASS